MTVRRNFTITKLERVTSTIGHGDEAHEHEHWQCRITQDGRTYVVHDRFGSWMRDGDHGNELEVPLEWKLALSEKVGKGARRAVR